MLRLEACRPNLVRQYASLSIKNLVFFLIYKCIQGRKTNKLLEKNLTLKFRTSLAFFTSIKPLSCIIVHKFTNSDSLSMAVEYVLHTLLNLS